MEKHVCLVFTPVDQTYQDALTHYGPPLGLIALVNHLQRSLPTLRISILDGSVTHGTPEIIAFIEKERPDFVAQSIQLNSYGDAIEIAQAAKAVGATTIVGGHQATQLARSIAFNQQGVIDYVVVNDGEEALEALVRGDDPADIPNLVLARDGVIHTTPERRFNIRSAAILDYSMVDITPYRQKLVSSQFTAVDDTVSNYTRIYSHKGCGNRNASSGCIFCGRADRGVVFKQPDQIWLDVRSAALPGVTNYIFDVGDDFLNSPRRLKSILNRRPDDLSDVQFGIFGRANRVTAEAAALLGHLNVKDVIIGFESGDEEVLEQCGKNDTTPQTNIAAAEYLFGAGVDVCASFVLGLPGETPQSLAKTYGCAKTIVRSAERGLGRRPREMVANLIEPSPGSPVFHTLAKAFPERYAMKDRLSLEDIQRDYFSVFFNLDTYAQYRAFRKELALVAKDIHDLVGFSDSQGWLDRELAST